ncbi:hypothetical protein PG988_014132 [Apiospora saccharicola]
MRGGRYYSALFVADAAHDESPTPSQAPRLAEALGAKTLASYHMLKESDGAGEHWSTGCWFLEGPGYHGCFAKALLASDSMGS